MSSGLPLPVAHKSQGGPPITADGRPSPCSQYLHALREDLECLQPQNHLRWKEVRRVEWIDGLDRAMGYIEENLRGEIDLAEAARHAACSQFHL